MRARGAHAACARYGRGCRASLRAGAAAAPRHGPKNGGTYCVYVFPPGPRGPRGPGAPRPSARRARQHVRVRAGAHTCTMGPS